MRLHAEGGSTSSLPRHIRPYPTDTEADELLAVRAVLEAESARLAAQHATAEHVERLSATCNKGRAGRRSRRSSGPCGCQLRVPRLHRVDIRQRLLAEILGTFERRVRWYHVSFARTRGRASWDEHAEIVEAISASKSGRARDLMRRHTEQTRTSYRQRAGNRVVMSSIASMSIGWRR